MTKHLWLLLAVMAMGSPLPVLSDELTDSLDGIVRQVVEDWEVPGLAIAVVKDGEVVFAEGYGTTQLGAGQPVDEHTLFAIGSTTKAMTAATIGMLVDEGKVSWDDPITRHLSGFRLQDPWVTREVTVRDALTHRAGLGNADLLWYGEDRSRQEIIDKLPLIDSAYSLRSGFIYQNIMYVVAGEVAAAAASTSWEDLMQARLFDPLGMTRTQATLRDADTAANVASPHDQVNGELVVIENASVDSVGPAGSVWSSVSDMSRWLRMLLADGSWGEDQLLEPETVAELLEPQTLLQLAAFYPAVQLIDPDWTTYGLGWFQMPYEGRTVNFHTGSIDGMAAIVGMIPDEDLAVVILENRDHAECRHALMWTVFDLWGGKTDGRDWSAELYALYDELATEAEAAEEERRSDRVLDTSPSLDPAAYAGTYSHETYDEAVVTMSDGHLHLEIGPELRGRLEHWNYDTFELVFDRRWQGEALATFSLGSDGRPARVDLMGLTFERVPEIEDAD